MAPPLLSRLWGTIRSHKWASWFLFVTLSPFYLPFLIVFTPIMLLFLAPVSVCFFSLFLLYKVNMFLRLKFKDFRGQSIGYQASRQIAAAERLDIYQQTPPEELKGLEGPNVQGAPLEEKKDVEGPKLQSVESHIHNKEEDEADSGMLPSRIREFEEEKLGLPKEHFAVQDGKDEDKITGRQLEKSPSMDEGRERSRQEGSPEDEEPNVSNVQNVELPVFLEAQGGEGLQGPEQERDFTGGALEDTGKELPQKDRMQHDKQEEEEKLGFPEEHFAVQDGRAEDELTERKPEQGPSVDEGRDRGRQEVSPEFEVPKVSDVQNMEVLAVLEEEGLQRPERERDVTEGAQSVESHIHDKEEDKVDPGMLPSRICEVEEEKLGIPEEHIAVQVGKAEDKITGRQLEQGPSMDEDRERSRQECSPEDEEPNVSDVQNVELPAFLEAQGGEGLQGPERERDFTEGALEDTGKELPQKDRMQHDKQEEEEMLGLPEEHFAVQDGRAEDASTERQLEQGLSVDEGSERGRQEGSPEYEELKVSDVQNIKLPVFLEAQGDEALQKPERERDFTEGVLEDTGEEGLQRPERERDFMEGVLEDTGKELPQEDRMQDDKQEDEEAVQESVHLRDEQKQAERESDVIKGTQEGTWKDLQQKDRVQDDEQDEKVAAQESIDLRDQQEHPERESDKLEEEEAIQESINLKGQQKQPEREEHDLAEGILEQELPQKDWMEDDKQEEEEAIQESVYLKDEQKQFERRRSFTEGNLEHMGKELPHVGRMEDDKQEEEETTQDSIVLKDKKRQPESESKLTEGTQDRMRTELSYIGRMEDDKQKEGEVYQESNDLNKKQREPNRESEFIEGTLEDVGKEPSQKERMEDSKQEEGEAISESIDSKDEQEQSSLPVDASTSHMSEEFRPLADEHESFDKPHSDVHQSGVPADREGLESKEDPSVKQESPHVHQFDEASSRLPSIEAELAAFPEHTVEEPHKEFSEQLAVDTPAAFETTREEPEPHSTPAIHEHTREEPELSSEEDSSPEILDNKGRLDMQKDIFFSAESSIYGSPESHGQVRHEPFGDEMKDDEQPRTGDQAKDLATSFDAATASEREEGYPSEATSSALSSPPESHAGFKFQDGTWEEQKIIADINTIKKIVGYQGEPHTSILEQIRALYLFLGMEPYDWAAEVDELQRMQAEIELLKIVVGVK